MGEYARKQQKEVAEDQQCKHTKVYSMLDNRNSFIFQKKIVSTIKSNQQAIQRKVAQLVGRNRTYRGEDFFMKLYRASDYAWEKRAMETGYLMSKGLKDLKGLDAFYKDESRMDTNTGEFATLSPRELRNRHAASSMHSTSVEPHTPTSNYISLTNDIEVAKKFCEKTIYRFDVLRSDLWQGGIDYDRGGVEKEWLAEGNTKIFNIEISVDRGENWRGLEQQQSDLTFLERLIYVTGKSGESILGI